MSNKNRKDISSDRHDKYLVRSGRGYSFIKPSYMPFYDSERDYRTNSLSYYDYLARFNKLYAEIVELLNRVARRNIEFNDTSSIDFTKEGDWIGDDCSFDDIVNISAVVRLSQEKVTKFGRELENALQIFDDGLYSPDYNTVLQDIKNDLITLFEKTSELEDMLERIKQELEERLTNLEKEVTSIKEEINLIDRENKAIEFMLFPPSVNMGYAASDRNNVLERVDTKLREGIRFDAGTSTTAGIGISYGTTEVSGNKYETLKPYFNLGIIKFVNGKANLASVLSPLKEPSSIRFQLSRLAKGYGTSYAGSTPFFFYLKLSNDGNYIDITAQSPDSSLNGEFLVTNVFFDDWVQMTRL